MQLRGCSLGFRSLISLELYHHECLSDTGFFSIVFPAVKCIIFSHGQISYYYCAPIVVNYLEVYPETATISTTTPATAAAAAAAAAATATTTATILLFNNNSNAM